MAFIDARILRTLRVTESQGEKQTKQLTATEDYLLIGSERNPSFGDALADATAWLNLNNQALPQLGDERTLNDTRFYCIARDLSWYKDNDRAIVMTVRYASKDEKDDEQPDPPEGTDAETWKRITIQTQQITEPARGWVTLDQAIDGGGQDTPRNSAGDPVDGLEEDTALVRLTYTNSQVTNPAFDKLNAYTNSCNSEQFLGGSAYTVRCTGWSGEWDQKNNVWSISVEFLYKPGDWSITFYDVGFNEILQSPSGGYRRYAILDERGNPVSKPVPLDGNGKAAAISDPSSGDSPVDLQFGYLYPYPARDMTKIWNDCRI
jgi:hypothetical protein